jgi:hypothetical protein
MSMTLNELIDFAKHLGYTVKFVHRNELRDYAGMNPMAAKEIGFKMPNDEIWIDRGLNDQGERETIIHELIETFKMKGGLKYWPAHKIALEEQDVSFKELKRKRWKVKRCRRVAGVPGVSRSQ